MAEGLKEADIEDTACGDGADGHPTGSFLRQS